MSLAYLMSKQGSYGDLVVDAADKSAVKTFFLVLSKNPCLFCDRECSHCFPNLFQEIWTLSNMSRNVYYFSSNYVLFNIMDSNI